MYLVFLGPLGAGKGTQAARVAIQLQIPHISTGEMFRQMADAGDPIGVYARDTYWGKGQNGPDTIANQILEARIGWEDCKNGFILDGYPRSMGQAYFLEDLMRKNGRDLETVIHIKISEKTIIERLSSRRRCPQCPTIYGLGNMPGREGICDKDGTPLIQRIDDTPEKIQQRLKVYHEETMPLVGFYAEIRKDIDGEKTPDEVFKAIMVALGAHEDSFK